MRTPAELRTLVDDGTIDEVLRPLMSGKEAQIYLVRVRGQQCVAKVYKQAQKRSFKERSDYTEGRKVRGSRELRAMTKGSRRGREQNELAWQSTEVETIYKLYDAGVRVPRPIHYAEGVLLMELVTDEHGQPAPRLGDLRFEPGQAQEIYQVLLRQVVRMACAGIVHGDLSDFNVLIGSDGPVLIDFPQASDPARNKSARKLLLRDVENLQRFLSRFVPGSRRLPYGEEIWRLLEQGQLAPETRLSGQFRESSKRVNTDQVLSLVHDADRDRERQKKRAAAQAPSRLFGALARGAAPPREPLPAAGEALSGSEAPRASLLRPRPARPGLTRPAIVVATSHRRHRPPSGDWARASQKRSGGSASGSSERPARAEGARKVRRG